MKKLLTFLSIHVILSLITYGLLGVYQKIGILDPTVNISMGDVFMWMYAVSAVFILLTIFILKKIDLW